MKPTAKTYSARDIMRITGALPERLKHWNRLRLLRVRAAGTGHYRRYDFTELVEAYLVTILDGLGLQTDMIEYILIYWRLLSTGGRYRVPKDTINRRRDLQYLLELGLGQFARELIEDVSDDPHIQTYRAHGAHVRRLLDPAARGERGYRLRVLPPDITRLPVEQWPDLSGLDAGQRGIAAMRLLQQPRVVFDDPAPTLTSHSETFAGSRPPVRTDVTIKTAVAPIDIGAIVIDLRAIFERLEAATGDRWPIELDHDAETQSAPALESVMQGSAIRPSPARSSSQNRFERLQRATGRRSARGRSSGDRPTTDVR
jgi:DNA-binding transcriptional MerR regulator